MANQIKVKTANQLNYHNLPILLQKQISFSYCLFVHGFFTLSLLDQQTNIFPLIINIKSNLGNFSTTINLKRNAIFRNTINGIDIFICICKWECCGDSLSFHLKVVAEKFGMSFTAVDEEVLTFPTLFRDNQILL